MRGGGRRDDAVLFWDTFPTMARTQLVRVILRPSETPILEHSCAYGGLGTCS